MSAICTPIRIGVEPGTRLEVEHRHLQMADHRQDRRLPVEAAASEPQVRRVGGKLVERRIDRQPQATARSFIQVHLGPRVVVERATHVDETHRNPGRDARRAGHRHIQRRVFVAVAHLGAQNLACRRKTDRRLFLEEAIHVSRELLGAGARAGHAAHRQLRLGDDLRRIALDERFRHQVACDVEVRGICGQTARIANLDDVTRDCLASALKIGVREIGPLQPKSQPADVAGIVDTAFHHRHNRRGLQQVGLSLLGHRHGPRLIGRFLD